MSSLTTNNITINKITSSNGKFSGDNASGRIELFIKNVTSSSFIIPWKFDIGEGGFVNIKFKSPSSTEEVYIYESVENYKYTSVRFVDHIIISGSKINGIYNKTETVIGPPPDDPVIYLNEEDVELKSFQFPKDSPEEIDCENIFANWNLQGEIPDLDDRISNLSGAFANTQISGKLPKLPKNLKYASNAFLNCSTLKGVSKDLLAQHVTAQKPYIKYQTSDSMVSGCQKSVTSWFSIDNGGDHDNIEYTEWTSSRNTTATTFPYIKVTLPRNLKDKHFVRAVFKNFERVSSYTNCLYCCRAETGKGGALFVSVYGNVSSNRIDSVSSQKYINANSGTLDIRLTDFQLYERTENQASMFRREFYDLNDYTTTISTYSGNSGTPELTLFASSVKGVSPSNQGKLAIAELDIWDDEGYLIKMRSQGTSMKDLVSGTTYSSASSTPFIALPVEIRDEDKEYLLHWEKFAEKTLPLNFWDEYSIALSEYKANPTKTEQWTVQFDKTTDTFSSEAPYFDTAPTKPLVNFFLTKVAGFAPGYATSNGKFKSPRSPFAANTNQIMYFPNATDTSYMISMLTALQHCPITPKGTTFQGCRGKNIKLFGIFPNSTSLTWIFSSSYLSLAKLYAPKITTMHSMFVYSYSPPSYLKIIDFECPNVVNTMGSATYGIFEAGYSPVEYINFKGGLRKALKVSRMAIAQNAAAKATEAKIVYDGDESKDVCFDSATEATSFASDRGLFNQVILFPSLSDGVNAFLNTSMSSRNIAKTLNSLPKWTDGKTHTITFTGCPGIEWKETTETFNGVSNCPLFTKDTEGKALRKAFAKAVTNGWTVEIGTATNAASTMSLRRLQYYKKTESECGDYVDSEGKTYIISTGDAFGPGGKNQDYEQFSSLEECLESWNLTEVVREEPVPFEEFIEEEQLDELENGIENFEEIASENDAS